MSNISSRAPPRPYGAHSLRKPTADCEPAKPPRLTRQSTRRRSIEAGTRLRTGSSCQETNLRTPQPRNNLCSLYNLRSLSRAELSHSALTRMAILPMDIPDRTRGARDGPIITARRRIPPASQSPGSSIAGFTKRPVTQPTEAGRLATYGR